MFLAAWRQPLCTSSCSSTSPLKVVVFPSPSLQLQMRKLKCLLAVGTRKRRAGRRKENQQRAGNNQQKIKNSCRSHSVLCWWAEKYLCSCQWRRAPESSAEGSFSQGIPLIVTFWSKVRERHKDAQNTGCCCNEWCRKEDPSAWACPCPREGKLKNKDAAQTCLYHLH